MVMDNLGTFNGLVREYTRSDLFPPERELLVLFREQIGRINMLDLGVGAGRTAYTFAALTRTYVGIDYAPAMIEACRRRFGETERQQFLCCDATDLRALADNSFDLALFSFNGIDCVNIDQRQQVLREVGRVLRPGGHFFFSTHSLDALPWPIDWPPFQYLRPFRSSKKLATKAIWHARRYLANRNCDLSSLKDRGWGTMQDGAHNFGLRLMYVTDTYQQAELSAHGFAIERRIGLQGGEPSAQDYAIHYLCRFSR
jgi:SAM-dependent methyltransferase